MLAPKVALVIGMVTAIIPKLLFAEVPVHESSAASAADGLTKSAGDSADYFLVQDNHTARCSIMQGRNFVEGSVNTGAGHKTRAEAVASMRATTLCRTE